MNARLLRSTSRGNTKAKGEARHIVGLLKSLGVPNQMLYARGGQRRASLWQRSINHLCVLEQARKLYRTQIVSVHPDKGGGNVERTILLNRQWFSIQKRFRAHGYELG